MKILFTGGGTAGHIFPIIAIVREIRKLGFDAKFFYIGPRDEFGSIFLTQERIKVKTILAGKLRRYFGWKSIFQNIIDILFKIPLGFLQSSFYIFFLTPDLIFSKGGYGSFAPVISSWMLRVPILLQESDVAPGLANRLMSKFALEIFVSFPVSQTEYFPAEKMISIGNPIRKEILEGSKEKANDFFHLTQEKPVILLMGGSQGAQVINDLILAILPKILNHFELIHQTGEKNFEAVKAEAKVVIPKDLEKYYHPIAFLQETELKDAYQAADLIVSRSGSGSIFEIAACGKPSILAPISISAQNHQVKNAYAYQQSGACLIMEKANLTPYFFLEKLKYLFSSPKALEEMSEKAKEFSKPEAAHIIAEYLVGYLVK